MMRKASRAAFGAAVFSMVARGASAQDADVGAAAEAFARAQEAELRGEPAMAAQLYETADRISPAPAALRNATRARLAAGQLASAAGLAEELERRYPDDAQSQVLAEDVLAQAKKTLVRVVARCDPECRLSIDGLAVSPDMRLRHVAYVQPGPHTLSARFDNGAGITRQIDDRAGGSLDVAFEGVPVSVSSRGTVSTLASPAEATLSPSGEPSLGEPRDDGGGGVSPVVGLVLGGLGLAAGGAAIWSAVDTRDARDDFLANPTRSAYEDGQQKDTRTNILIVVGATLGVASATLLVFATDWSGGEQAAAPRLELYGSPLGSGLRLRGRL